MRIDPRHHRQKSRIRNPQHAHAPVIVRHILQQPVDRVVRVRRLIHIVACVCARRSAGSSQTSPPTRTAREYPHTQRCIRSPPAPACVAFTLIERYHPSHTASSPSETAAALPTCLRTLRPQNHHMQLRPIAHRHHHLAPRVSRESDSASSPHRLNRVSVAHAARLARIRYTTDSSPPVHPPVARTKSQRRSRHKEMVLRLRQQLQPGLPLPLDVQLVPHPRKPNSPHPALSPRYRPTYSCTPAVAASAARSHRLPQPPEAQHDLPTPPITTTANSSALILATAAIPPRRARRINSAPMAP